MRFRLLVAALLISTPALSDWQYTKWGMSPDEVIAASKTKLKPCTPAACKGQSTGRHTALSFGEYRSGEFTFRLFALFDNISQKLTVINLELKDPSQAPSLIGALRGRYGEPVDRSKSPILSTWIWREPRTQISLIMIGETHATLQYSARMTDSNKGL